MKRLWMVPVLLALSVNAAAGQALGPQRVAPNLEGHLDTPLRYTPDNGDFVITNGSEFFNRPLYGGNTAFRVDAGDKPEFSMYLPGRGGNLRLGIRTSAGAKWLNGAQTVEARYRPGGMIYDIRDPLLGANGQLHIEAYALAATEGLVLKIEGRTVAPGVELLWAYGGVNGQRGTRDGDIGTERVPISEYFQLSPDFCKGNTFETAGDAFTLKSTPATIFGRTPGTAVPELADARQWASPEKLFSSVKAGAAPELAVAVGHVPLTGEAQYLSLQRVGAGVAAGDLATYREVTATRPAETAAAAKYLPPFTQGELPKIFADAAAHFQTLRRRVTVETPDAYLDAGVGALNVAADAVWDDPQRAIMHGAIAWRTRLLGWRGPYSLDALGWHDRARQNMEYWATRQNKSEIPAKLPPPDEASNLARSEAALHSNGDMSNSHYDMNLVHIDAVFRHLLWTGDLDFARKEWPVIERHLAWEQRLFRRPYGDSALYEAYAAIWASDDLQYSGGATTHASAYNLYHNQMAARLAKAIGKDPAPYEREAQLISKGMREQLWLNNEGWYAEYRDLLGLKLAHPAAAVWTFYHAVDSGATTPLEAWQMSRYVDTQIPHIPVTGPGVPAGEKWAVVPTSTWMPYTWSINNVCMNENAHTALAYWQAGRREEAHTLLTSAMMASMYMGISPGNVGTMDYLDVYRRESQRDFGDGSGTLSRAVVEGLFGLRPDALAGEFNVVPGFPAKWEHAKIDHPDASFAWRRTGQTDTFNIAARFPKPMALKLEWPAHADDVAGVTVNGQPAKWEQRPDAVGTPRVLISAPAAATWDVVISSKGSALAAAPAAIRVQQGGSITAKIDGVQAVEPALADPQKVLTQVVMKGAGFDAVASGIPGNRTVFTHVKQGAFTWWLPVDIEIAAKAVAQAPAMDWSKSDPTQKFETVDLSKLFNDRVTQIFKHEYRTPRSPYVSLALPKQGIGAWAGHVNATATIDDAGLRAAAAKNDGQLRMPNGAPFATPAAADAPNILFTSQWDNFPKEAVVPLSGKASRVLLLMAGSTNPMQSRLDNGEVIVTYTDGTTARLALNNPATWWPIEQDYFIDDYQFRRPEPVPPRVHLRTGEVRLTTVEAAKGKGGTINGGAATALDLALDPTKELKSLTVRTLANDVVIGLMSATLVR